jgi:hypothetical protein
MGLDFLSREKRKRRVGATARVGLIERGPGNWTASDRLPEIAAPLEVRTPTGTVAKPQSSADGSMATKARRVEVCRKKPEERQQGKRRGVRSGRRAEARLRLCLKLRQGASPLRPPAPFPWCLSIRMEENLSRVRKPRKGSAPLTDFLPSEQRIHQEGKGAKESGFPRASRWSASRGCVAKES